MTEMVHKFDSATASGKLYDLAMDDQGDGYRGRNVK